MRVLLYTATDPEAPLKWVAAAIKPGETFPTWYCAAESPSAARAKMDAFIARSTPKPRPGRPKKAAMVADLMDGEVL
jgi:hypothetical protein